MNSTTRIKICGISTLDAMHSAADAGADYVGFVHWAKSPRFIEIESAGALAEGLPATTTPVSLFVDAPIEQMLTSPFEWIQLHGREDETTCRRLREAGHRIIRGFHFSPEAVERWNACPDVDRLLVDGSRIGGTGETFDHDALRRVMPSTSTPLLVAGGLHDGNVANAIRATGCWGVDVSSGVEASRGTKDAARIRSFCAAVREADAGMI
ncbi:MAG: phosphoribosylanthranilate isomerase [Planctomycetota bacterium]|nr:phosphoribosylanthranilate isomerase [Planctomycetota bacterium]